MNGQRYRETPLDIERLRRLNRATVERYMAMKGAERLQRHSLFVEDGCAELDHGKRRTPGFPGP